MTTTTWREFQPALLWVVVLWFWPLQSMAQQPSAPSMASPQSLELVREVISQAREAGIAGNPNEISPLAVETGVIRLGDAALPGALVILGDQSEEPIVLDALLRAAVELAGLADARVCSLVQDFLVAAAERPNTVPWGAALGVLRSRTGDCHEAIHHVAALYKSAETRKVRLEVIDVLGWLGRSPDDFELVTRLASEAPDECERRLLAAAGLRIFDRLMPPKHLPGT